MRNQLLSAELVSITPSNVEITNKTFISKPNLVDKFLKTIHTNHMAYFDRQAEQYGIPIPEKVFGLFELS